MTMNRSALLDMGAALKSTYVGELIRRTLAMMRHELIDAEATSVIGAGLHERCVDRTTQRNVDASAGR